MCPVILVIPVSPVILVSQVSLVMLVIHASYSPVSALCCKKKYWKETSRVQRQTILFKFYLLFISFSLLYCLSIFFVVLYFSFFISIKLSMIVWVNVILNRTVVDSD